MHDDGERQAVLAKEVKAEMLEYQASLFDRSQNYTTIVIFGGYAAFFAIWSLTKDHMSKAEVYWSALLLGISVLTFVVFEIFKMVVVTKQMLTVRTLLVSELPPDVFLERRKALKDDANKTLTWLLLPIWAVAFAVSLLSGIAASGLLMVSFASYLAK